MASFDDVPGLDDMTELVQGIKLNKQKHSQQKAGDNAQVEKIQSLENPVVSVTDAKKPKEGSNLFGGMTKGFLFGKQQQKPKAEKRKVKSTQPSDIISPQHPSESKTQDSLVFDEVQDAMRLSQKMDQSWLTNDLLKQVESNEKLSKQLADPHIAKAISFMQKDPRAAMEYYKNDKEIQNFFLEFYDILGNHFTQLSAEQKVPANASSASSEEERKMQDILSDPEIRAILLKPDIQKLIELLRNDPDEAQKHLNSSNPSFRADVNKLVSTGVLAFQQQ